RVLSVRTIEPGVPCVEPRSAGLELAQRPLRELPPGARRQRRLHRSRRGARRSPFRVARGWGPLAAARPLARGHRRALARALAPPLPEPRSCVAARAGPPRAAAAAVFGERRRHEPAFVLVGGGPARA